MVEGELVCRIQEVDQLRQSEGLLPTGALPRSEEEMKPFGKYITEASASATRKNIRVDPYTICDLLKDPKPTRFIDLVKGDIPDATGKWVRDLERVFNAFENWFESQGGRKMHLTNIFADLVACKGRAPWAAWSGKAYRGVSRSRAVVSKYRFTGDVKTVNGNSWLIAKGTYKSRYEAQSWSDEWKTAEEFAKENNLSQLGTPIPVVFEVDLKKDESLLSADVIKKISGYGKREREVIRVGNKPIPVTIYVNAYSIVDAIDTDLLGLEVDKVMKQGPFKSIYDRAIRYVGVKGADALAKTKEFKKMVKDYDF